MQDLRDKFQSAVWRPAGEIARPFVRHPHPAPSPGVFWQVGRGPGASLVTVVIPTIDADRGGYFAQLLGQISRQTLQQYELIVVLGDPRQGRAINVAAALAQGRYVLTLDDDTSIHAPETFANLVAVLETCPEIGMVGGNNVIPDDASPFVRRAMRQIPRRSWMPVKEVTESDLAEHPCLVMRTEEFKAVGGENELLPRGLDPYLRQAFRDLGKRVVVAPGVLYSHLPPTTWRGLLRQFVRNGRQAAFVNRHYPQWAIETPSDHGAFTLRVPFWVRAVRFPWQLAKALLTGKPIWCLCEVAYAVGFLQERWRKKA
ncbi:MAG: glycosyltransferase family 2 protein [Nitrospirae bacterium]|nr:MAG: glycosyltransferase family 2 protein [Nitrospirota bacterium]